MSKRGKNLGRYGEQIACAFLKKKGYKILVQNYRTRKGEIDIIAEDKNTIVFVEVKSRSGRNYGDPIEYVDFKKKKRLLATAFSYITKNKLWDRPIRFDVVGIVIKDKGTNFEHEKDVISIDHTLDSGNTYWQPW